MKKSEEHHMYVVPVEEGEECDICDQVKELVAFDWDMSESQICHNCLIKIYRESGM